MAHLQQPSWLDDQITAKVACEILISHADALSFGYDVTAILAARYPDLTPLLRIATSVYRSLEMAPVPVEFREQLYRELIQSPLPYLAQPRVRAGAIIGLAALGSALTGVAAWSIHRIIYTRQPLADAHSSG